MKFLLHVAFLLNFTVYAQNSVVTVKGTLLDEKSKEPIAYASVFLKGKSIGTTTNNDGKFLFHVPSGFVKDTLIISFIGYDRFKTIADRLAGKDNVMELKQQTLLLNEVVVKSSKKELTAKEIVKKAVARIPENYPMKPFIIEGFFRDLQRENDRPVELLEAATRFRYTDYNPGYEEVEIIEVRRSYNKRHPVNGTYDRHNSIVDLMEDNYVKHRFGPIRSKRWDFKIEGVLNDNNRMVYKISGTNSPVTRTILYIDGENFSILKLELTKQMINGEFYRRYINLPDPYGLQETSFKMIFEFQRIDDKMYLKYQREEDAYNVFNKTTNEMIVRQSFVKELFVNNVITENLDKVSVQKSMNMNKSVEGQATPFNPDFWKYYNAPIETANDSEIIKELGDSALQIKR
ncbi:MAG TPA: carboxypeptidase-like regulatory domain-containing protein [Cyclobacteriaceae bacterium]